ncbi:MAG: LPS export ABC transporter periplasmic protein LptC, partial [Gemmobacter sp.]|nr:LPS export ABC transporter periplasmic protein LptC [Gemmobacter sp.]
AAMPGATPDVGGRADRPRLLLVAPDGRQTSVEADEARIDPAAQTLLLTGAVKIRSAEGYHIDSALVVATLDRTRIESPGPVTADTPQGNIEAGTMLLERTDATAPEVLVFKGGVKLLYDPAK